MNKFKCSKCGKVIMSPNKTAVQCTCGYQAFKSLHVCESCGEETYFSAKAKVCSKCAEKQRIELMRVSVKKFKSPNDSYDVPKEILKNKSPRIQHIIKYNWWSNNEFCLKVAECKTDAEAEKLLLDLNRSYGKMQYVSNSGYVDHS